MSVLDYKSWSSEEMIAKLEQIRIDSTGLLTAPELEIPPCGECNSKAIGVYESDPSTARFNEGAVHYRVTCSNEACDEQRENVWDMSPYEAIHRFVIPTDFKLKDND